MAAASTLPIPRLPDHLRTFPQQWPFPKGDLYHWIPLLNRFDRILDRFNTEYGLHDGPQLRPFGRALLLKGVAEENKAENIVSSSPQELDNLSYAHDGDRQLIEAILDFSRWLLENCGNRSLYNSSECLGGLLNTTSLSLLTATLRLAVRLAQRYHASRQRGVNASQHLNSALLASHYNIDLEKVQKLANPFTKSQTQSIATPKGKEKAQNQQVKAGLAGNANDFLSMTQTIGGSVNGSVKHIPTSGLNAPTGPDWKEWGSVLLTYYHSPAISKEDPKPPTTPTPVRRPSGLSRQSRLSSTEGSPDLSSTASAASTTKPDESAVGGMRRLEIPYSRITSSSVEDILHDSVDAIPKDSRYELLTSLRNARAIVDSLSARQEIVGIRLLAITNLAYIYPENVFQQKILQQDSEEPRQMQLVYQLADLVHPPSNKALEVSPKLQTLALGTLEAFAKQKTKAADVCAALNINVNHGVLFYVLQRAVAEMAIEDSGDASEHLGTDERQEALFSLLEALPTSAPRTGETLIAAGLLDILIEVLNLRTKKAERAHPKVLTFLSTFLYTVRDSMQSLANSKGLDAISDLLSYEVQISLERAAKGDGLPEGFKTRSIDYQIPYFQQQSLRVLFKLIAHMMSNGSTNLDRLLRNLIDSPQLLGSLHSVITNATIFGSAVWSGAINIMSVFIHNEPTSYAVISEAGLSKGLLEAITSAADDTHPMKLYLDYMGDSEVSGAALTNPDPGNIAKFMHQYQKRDIQRVKSTAIQGILPNSDAILGVPQAFGAICLNHSGMQLFLESGALDSFFRIFESDEHIKALLPTTPDKEDLPRLLGSSFDELVRHHPNLKMPVMIAIVTMVERVGRLCRSRAKVEGCGAKLWLSGKNGELVPAGDDAPLKLDNVEEHEDGDVVMGDASPTTEEVQPQQTDAGSPGLISGKGDDKQIVDTAARIEVAMNFLTGFFENSALCSFFVEASGARYVFDLATVPSLQYDFNIHNASVQLARVIHIMVEQKPYLILPPLLQLAQKVTDSLKPLYEFSGKQGFFAEFTSSNEHLGALHASIGTSVVKSLVYAHTMCNILYEVFSNPIYAPRSGHPPYSQVNLADKYGDLIKTLGQLQRVCVWEEILLQKSLPKSWKEPTKTKGLSTGSDEADEVLGVAGGSGNVAGPTGSETSYDNSSNPGSSHQKQEPVDSSTSDKEASGSSITKDEKTAAFKNTKVLRHLLSQVPSLVILFYQNLGKALVAKRRPESYARQNAYLVADAISDAVLGQLQFEPPKETASMKDHYAYWIVAITSVSSLMIEGGLANLFVLKRSD